MRDGTRILKLNNMCAIWAAQSGIADSEAYHRCSLRVSCCLRSTTALVGGSGRLAGLSWEVAVAPVAQCSSSCYAGSCWFSDVDDDGHAAAFLCLR